MSMQFKVQLDNYTVSNVCFKYFVKFMSDVTSQVLTERLVKQHYNSTRVFLVCILSSFLSTFSFAKRNALNESC